MLRKKNLFVSLVLSGLLLSQMADEAFADASVQLEQAETYMEDGKYEQAEAIYKAIVTDYPGADDAFKAQEKLTVLYIAWDKQPEAEAAYQELLTKFSEHKHIAEAVDDIADEYRELRKYEKALEVYKSVVSNWPEAEHAIDSQKDVAISNILLGDEAGAQSAIDKLLADFSGNRRLSEVVDNVADAYREARKYEKARQLYQHVVANWPEAGHAVESQRGVALANILLGDDVKGGRAIEEMVNRFAEHKNIARALDHLADDLRELGRYKKARDLYKYVVDHWPQDDDAADAQGGVARSSILLGDEAGAQAAVSKLIADFGTSAQIADAVDNVAEEYRKAGQFVKARQWYQYVVDRWPQDKHAMEAQGGVVMSNIGLGDESGALAAIDELVTKYSGNRDLPKCLYHIARKCERSGKGAFADGIYQRIIRDYSDSSYATKAMLDTSHMNILSLIEAGQDSQAQAAYDSLIAAFGDHPKISRSLFFIGEGYYDRALQNESQGRDSEAKANFGKAIAVWQRIIDQSPDPGITEYAYYFSAMGYSRLGDRQKAVAYYQKVVDDWPDFKFAWNALFMIGRIHESLEKSGSLSKSEAEAKIAAAYTQLLEEYPDCKAATIAIRWLSHHNSK